ncbi:MAG TPA: TadE/TadG family type IV pilus assembly protein [Nitrospira sp.]|nr:TadE/TadG family type IV pilus assembly protein [Nitrospira sp.]
MTARRRALDQRGAAALEFAILLPLFIMFVWGAIEFGLAYYTQEVLTNATREGARAGIVQAIPKPTIAQIQGVVSSYVQAAGLPTGGLTTAVTGAGGAFPAPLTVTSTYPYSFRIISMITAGSVPNSITLRASTVMRNE